MGGAVLLTGTSEDFNLAFRNSIFKDNASPYGAALAAYRSDPGSPVVGNAKLLLDNCLFEKNKGEKATIAVREMGTVLLLNCNLVENEAGGLLIANDASLHMQNSILYNPGTTEFRLPAPATANFTSLGGNLVRDHSMADWLTGLDLSGTDPLFSGPGEYQLSSGSPCIDAGLNEGVTCSLDLAGNPRIANGQVDIGVYESTINDTQETLSNFKHLEVYPNPASDYLHIQLPRYAGGTLEVTLYDCLGRLLDRQVMQENQPVSLREMLPGVYLLQLKYKRKIYRASFVVK